MKDTENKQLKERPPIVVVMGHVDHGKTTLLDFIRKANVAGREAGGITQSIGAYEITHNGKKITFIDTPGHEAFSKMRSRGATAADLAILVIAADEGLRPQTEEVIKILETTKTPFIVALNKVDKPGANLEKVKNELLGKGVLLEGLGGSVSYHAISAKTGEGVDELLDLILLAAEVEGLTYDSLLSGSGYILEAKMDKQRGHEASLILKNGVLRQGDLISTATAKGKVKILEDFKGARANELYPSAPTLVIGFESLPEVGEEFSSGEGLQDIQLKKVIKDKLPSGAEFDEDTKALRLILKASDAGSLEALSVIVKNLPVLEGQNIRVVEESVGDVNDNDVKLAIATKSLIIGFKSNVVKASKSLAETHKIKIITSEIVYELVKSIEELLKEGDGSELIGELEVLAVFNKERLDKQVVGGKVARGTFRARSSFDVMRVGKKIGTGRLTNLQSQKKDVNQVPEGSEAGLKVGSDVVIEIGDKLAIRK